MSTRAQAGLGMLVLTVGVLATAGTATADLCWNCIHDGNMFICQGVAQGTGTLSSCGATWDFDPPGYCKTVPPGAYDCGGGGGGGGGGSWCHGCYRYPVAVGGVPHAEEIISTQVLVFEVAEAGYLRAPSTIRLSGSSGLDPHEVATELASVDCQPGVLIGYSVASDLGMTVTRQRTADGSGLVVQSNRSPGGFGTRIYALGSGASMRTLLGAKEAAVFSTEIGGKRCLVVVRSEAFVEESGRAEVTTLHGRFTDAAEGYESLRLAGIEVDLPPAASVGIESFAVQAMVDNMRDSMVRRSYR